MLTNSNTVKDREFIRTLYFEFLKIFIISLVISLFVYFAYGLLADYIIDNNYVDNDLTIKFELEQIFSEIEENDLQFSIEETIDYINSNSDNYRISNYNYSEQNIIYTVGNDYNEDVYAYYKNIAGKDVVLLISDIHVNNIKLFYRLLGVVLALTVFITLLRKQATKYMRYLRDINKGIKEIAKGKYNNRIETIGDNELTELAYAINMMAFDIKKKIFEKEEIEKKQRQLITNVSHDLKTPLTSIIGYLDITMTLLDDKVDPSIISYLDRALVKSKQQQQLITKLFEYSKIINTDVAVHIREIDLSVFVRQYTELVSYDIKFINFTKKYRIMVDPDLLQRVFDNIFSNIDKYGVPDEKVIVSLNDMGNKTYLSIENKTTSDLTGKTDLIFDRTYVEEKSRTRNSSGLGLSIVKEMLSLMNVDIKAEFNEPYLAIVLIFKNLKL